MGALASFRPVRRVHDQVYDFPGLEEVQAVPVDPSIFAEGLDGHRQSLLLSWRERVMLVYSLPDLPLRPASPGREGATHSGSTLWFSDGSITVSADERRRTIGGCRSRLRGGCAI